MTRSASTSDRAPLTLRFTLTHGELARAWLFEYYRRGLWGVLRLLGGPALVVVGWTLRQSGDGLVAAFGAFAVGYGVYYAVKPLLHVAFQVRRRVRVRADLVETTVRFGDDGIDVEHGASRTHIGWVDVGGAGRSATYLWFELPGGNRAPLPLRAVDDVEAVIARFREHDVWLGR